MVKKARSRLRVPLAVMKRGGVLGTMALIPVGHANAIASISEQMDGYDRCVCTEVKEFLRVGTISWKQRTQAFVRPLVGYGGQILVKRVARLPGAFSFWF